jgi:hypothetical protein
MHSVTRRRIHVDRIATAWAIRRFIDHGATFEFVSWRIDPKRIEATPFDIRGAELSHHNGRCRLDPLIDKYELTDEAVRRMAHIIRAADLPHEELVAQEAAGVRAIFDGIHAGIPSDDDRLERGSAVCDALYAYCQLAAYPTPESST